MCPGSVNRGAAVFQSVWGKKKMKQRRLLFAPYLVPPTPSLWRFLLKGFLTEEREGGEGLEEVSETWGKTSAGEDGKRLFCMVFNAFFFSWRIVGLLRGFRSSNDSVFACAHGDCECLRLDACAGFTERMELALWNCE